MHRCPICHNSLPSFANICPTCGVALAGDERGPVRRKSYFFTIMACILSLMILLGYFDKKEEEPAGREAEQDPEPAAGPAWEGTVISVHDGDSLRVSRSGRTVVVRLFGIDAPEMATGEWPQQPYAEQARRELRSILPPGAKVDVRVDQAAPSHGRVVATLLLQNGEEVNRVLLERGAAWFYAYHCRQPFCDGWRAAQEKARHLGLGVWGDAGAVPPWQWRAPRRNN